MADKRFPGTTYEKKRGKWKGQVRKNGKTQNLGYFLSQEEAYAAVLKAKEDTNDALSEINGALPTSYLSSLQKSRRTETVAQSNVLIERPWSMTILEARIFVLLLRGLQGSDIVNKRITVPIADLIGAQHVGGRTYQLLHAALDSLGAIRIDLPMPNKKNDYHKAPLMGSLQLDSGQGTISGYFSTEVMPYLTNLIDSFTLGQVADLLSIKNPNTYKYYWLMLMWKFRSPHTVAIDELRALTSGQDTYPQFSDYRNRVLKPSLEELKTLNFDISYTEKKVGRAVDAIEFHIKYSNTEKARSKQLQLTLEPAGLPVSSSPTAPTDFKGRVAGRMLKFKLETHQIDRILLLSEEELKRLMKETHQLLKEYESGTKVFDNIAATAMSRINQLFPRLYPKAK